MKLYTGTSGYSYKEWKGNFYPEKLSDKKMLSYYAEHFSTVEINNTFYRMPKKEVLENWKEQVPADFKFILKAPKQITHITKLEDKETAEYFINVSKALGEKRGPLLFQLPPYSRKDLNKINRFCEIIPKDTLAAFEFRHQSWFDEESLLCLKQNNAALCLSDTDEEPVKEIPVTSEWGYLRLRKTDYSGKELSAWHQKIKDTGWKEAYVFFKHEDEGKGPLFAKKFLEIG